VAGTEPGTGSSVHPGGEAAEDSPEFPTTCLQTGIKLALPVIALVFWRSLYWIVRPAAANATVFYSISFSLLESAGGTMAATVQTSGVGWAAPSWRLSVMR